MIIILYLDAGWFRLCWLDVNGAGGSPICSISSFRLTRWWSGLDGGSEGFGIMLLPVALKVGSVAWSEERLGGSGISLRATDIVSQVEPSVLDQFPPAVFTDILERHSLVNLSTIQSNNTWILEWLHTFCLFNSIIRLGGISSVAITWILTLSGLCDPSWHYLLQMVFPRYLLKSSAVVFGINLLVLHH